MTRPADALGLLAGAAFALAVCRLHDAGRPRLALAVLGLFAALCLAYLAAAFSGRLP